MATEKSLTEYAPQRMMRVCLCIPAAIKILGDFLLSLMIPHNIMAIRCVLILSISLGSLSHAAQAEEYAIFTLNPEMNPISRVKAKMIFIGKIKFLKPVGKISLLDWPIQSVERKIFYRQLLNKTTAQVNAQWASLAFSGRVSLPMSLSQPSSENIRHWLMTYPQGITYAPLKQVPEGANILLILGRSDED